MKRHLGNSGFSLIEVMIASAVLGIIVASTLTLMSTSTSNHTFKTSVQANNSCLAEAHKVMTQIKEKGMARAKLHMPIALQVLARTIR